MNLNNVAYRTDAKDLAAAKSKTPGLRKQTGASNHN
jgi:hypothetical protein